MKKIICVLIFALCCGLSELSAQYAVGDVFEKDDVKAVVFYVDETGEHGLAITLNVVVTKEDIKKAQADLKAQKKAMTKEEKLKQKEEAKDAGKRMQELYEKMKGYYADLESLTTVEGKHNAKVIKDYCKEKGIDMQVCFPTLCWAETLGEGWFIPGEKEAALYADFISYGVGEPAYKKVKNSEMNEKYNNLNNAVKSNSGYENYSLPKYVQTTTVGRNKFFGTEFALFKSLELRQEQKGIGAFSVTVLYYDIKAYYPMSWIFQDKVAVCEF